MDNGGVVFEKQGAAKMVRSKVGKPPTRLQKQAPASLQLDPTAHNSFAPSSVTVIPLLSPLILSPKPTSSGGTGEFRFPGVPDKNDSLSQLQQCQGVWQHPAMADHSDRMALLTMFQTKFMLVNDSH